MITWLFLNHLLAKLTILPVEALTIFQLRIVKAIGQQNSSQLRYSFTTKQYFNLKLDKFI